MIVESPTKARTIGRFLPRDGFRIEASMGHVRDLPASADEIPKQFKGEQWARLGVKLDNGFEPLYVVPPAKKKVVSHLKQALKEASEVYIATDEDREGESIGWHLVELLTPNVPVRRMVFHEITAEAIAASLEQTRDIDRNLVDAQEARRILDRLVGYTISPVLWKKIAPRLSAGRVQSVAVRLTVLREKERIAFVPSAYWDVEAELAKAERPFRATLMHVGGVRVATGRDFDSETGALKASLKPGKDVLHLDRQAAERLATRVEAAAWRVTAVEERVSKRAPAPPFTTSTLQQEASRKLGLSAKETMRVAQGLYENGYITYMRTDSTHLSNEAIQGARRAVQSRYGEPYLSPSPRQYAAKSKLAQEAHEAIRPAGRDMRTADEHKLKGVQARLYDLIWKRTVATQMAEARLKFVTANLEVGTAEERANFRASGRTTLFPGFFRAYVEGTDDPEAALDDQEQPLPELTQGDRVDFITAKASGHETKPPARYTEASLVKLLEQEGIGRPSTYASIIDTIVERGYVRKAGPQLIPTFTAFATTHLLERQFEQLVDTGFTAEMEEKLDDIAGGKLEARPYLRAFYRGEGGIESRCARALEEVDGREVATLTFPKWGDYVVRVGRFGPYVEAQVDGQRVTASLPEDLAPGDLTADQLAELIKLSSGDHNAIGRYPDTGEPMFLKVGPYGPYLQLGDNGDGEKPKRVSLPKNVKPDEVDFDMAVGLLSLPRRLGNHPDTDEAVQAGVGRFGPYVRQGKTYASLGADDDVLTVGLERALELLSKKAARNRVLRVLGTHPESGKEVELREGRYGPYVKHVKVNASLPKGQSVDEVTLEQALDLLAQREAKGGKGRRRSTRKTAKSSAKGSNKTSTSLRAARSKAGAKGKGKKAQRSKATPKDLEAFLSELASADADVVTHIEGMKGRPRQDVAAVANRLGLSEEEVKRAHKRAMFKLRMAHGKARKAQPSAS